MELLRGEKPAETTRVADRLAARLLPEPAKAATTLIVVPVHPSDRAVKSGTTPVTIAGKEVAAPLSFVYPEYIAPTPSTAAGSRPDPIRPRVVEWLGPTPVWRTAKQAPTSAAGVAAGYWVAAIAAPEGTDLVVVEGQSVPVLPSIDPAGKPSAGRRPVGAFAQGVLGAFRQNPMLRWRARLAAGEPLVASASATDSFAESTIEALAATLEREWNAALARVAEADAKLFERLRQRLAGMVDLGDGVTMPLWTQDMGSLDVLRRAILSSGEEHERCARIVVQWLDDQPTAGAVVVDDAAALDAAAGVTFPSVMLLNLADRPVAAWATRAESSDAAMLRLEPLTATFASVAAERKVEGHERREVGFGLTQRSKEDPSALVRIGDWRAERSIVGRMTGIHPPGLEIGGPARPLMADWTVRSFLTAALDQTPLAVMPMSTASRQLAARLAPSGENSKGDVEARWQLYLEIGGKPSDTTDPWEIVVYLGPRSAAGSDRLRVLPDGSLIEIRGGQATPMGRATPVRSASGVSMWVPIPGHAIEAGKVLRLGLVWIDGQGRRSAWPRPMLPWQTEPGRIAVDLSTWSPVKE